MDRFNCQCCDKQKDSLQRSVSSLIPGVTITMCKTCLSQKHEPKFYVILAFHAGNNEAAKQFVKNNRYCGNEITAKQIVNDNVND